MQLVTASMRFEMNSNKSDISELVLRVSFKCTVLTLTANNFMSLLSINPAS